MQSTLIRETLERQPFEKAAPPSPSERMRNKSRNMLLWGLCLFVLSQAGLRWLIDQSFPILRDPRFEIKAARFHDERSK